MTDPLNGWMVARIKHKCVIMLRSLLEGNKNRDIVSTMSKILSANAIAENLVNAFIRHRKQYGSTYTEEAFRHDIPNPRAEHHSDEYLETILEFGFNLYAVFMHLMNDPRIVLDNRKVLLS